MNERVAFTLHVDAFHMAIGGAFTVYDSGGRKKTVMVYPAFVGGEKTLQDATAFLVGQYERLCGIAHQLSLEDVNTSAPQT